MSKRQRGLGRGLDALLGDMPETEADAERAEAEGELCQLPIEAVERGRYQPRSGFDPDALQQLADSIRVQGVVQPIVVRRIADERYELIAGERRWRAAQQAGLTTIPALVRAVSDEAAVAVGLIENIQREDLNPLEEASALRRLTEDFGLTHQAVADAVGRSRASVSNLLRLLELAPEVRTLIGERRLEMGHARAVAGLDRARQADVAQRVAAKGLSVRETEALVRRMLDDEPEPKPQPEHDPNIERLQQDLASRIGARVEIKHSHKGKGQLVIRYNSLDELDGILGHIQ